MATTAKKKTPEVVEVPAAEESAQAETPGVFVYIGPNIRGVIHESAIITGKLSEVKAQLSGAIERYPQIASLIIPAASLADSRRDVKTSGTLLHAKYMALAAAVE